MMPKGHESLILSSVVSMSATVITGMPKNEVLVHDEIAVLGQTVKEIPRIISSHSISILNRTFKCLLVSQETCGCALYTHW